PGAAPDRSGSKRLPGSTSPGRAAGTCETVRMGRASDALIKYARGKACSYPGRWSSWAKILYTINNVSREGNRSRGEGDGRTATEQGRAIARADRDMGMSVRYGPGGLSSGTHSWPKRAFFSYGTEATMRRDSPGDSADGTVAAGFEREKRRLM